MFKLFHYRHDETKARWEFLTADINTERDFVIVCWKVTCLCGVIKFRKRAYPLWSGKNRKYSYEYTYEEIIEKAKVTSGDNYHI